ncbi:beta-hexosaminidase 3 [Asparagus officinalis]|uniref:beta-hexosaminidase 3 n=1 Tax=Asparagus officinalis TaxID=4686 RepID=UPI00098E0D45|nr:beta-hexosaminidase 3 [Asparagus officinalis]
MATSLGVLLGILLLLGSRAEAGGVNLLKGRNSSSLLVTVPEISNSGQDYLSSRGSKAVRLGEGLELRSEGSRYADGSGVLKDAFSRVLDEIKAGHAVDGGPSGSGLLAGVRVVILSPDDELNYNVDESYKLSVPATGNPIYALIQAQTVYGALHALQTFSQLCDINLASGTIEISLAPWTIIDRPRFPYRGLLIDTSRHYLPVPVIKSVIDSMTYSKLNVLHWHIVDTQSFPLQIPSYPKLWNGAYSSVERYTIADAVDIVHYAERRGINVLAEIDVPGHALSWGKGYPYLWPSTDCQQPLDVSKESTFKVIDGILSDFSKVFKFRFVHLGGDEVNTSCWTITPHVREWLKQHKMDESGAYEYFVLRAQKIALSHGYEVINWEETFNNFGNKLNPRTVVHNWLGGGVAEKVVAAGLRCIVSNQDKWYLDHLDATWQGFYMNEPLVNISRPEQQKLVIGGEVCMWGEHIDASDIQQTIWPRAAAAAERLWSPLEKLAKDPELIAGRLAHFRCLLNQRGVPAAPLDGLGREAPRGPGSCYKQ